MQEQQSPKPSQRDLPTVQAKQKSLEKGAVAMAHAPETRNVKVHAAALVCLGGACYGFNATCYKFSYAAGFSSAQTAAAQIWFAFFFFAALLFARRVMGRRWDKIGVGDALKLMGTGCVTCLTTILYTYAMSVLPVPLALTLLFQFTWMGTAIQVVSTRRAPAACQVVSALVILLGTVFASGLYATDLSNCNPWGIAAGLLVAMCVLGEPLGAIEWAGVAVILAGVCIAQLQLRS